jgi:pimeloyl-ACP methyl ester carboxylesterase
MSEAEVNGVRLYYELHGSGEPLALVHGSWADATVWRFVVPGLAENFHVLGYDRRGHSRSERPARKGSFDEDGDDLAALLEALDLAPAHVVTNSSGGNIALRLATRRPAVFRSLSCHEPALWGAARGRPREPGDSAAGRWQPRGGRRADRRGRSRGRGPAVRRGGRLRPRRVGERATPRGEGDLRAERSHVPGRAPGSGPGKHRGGHALAPGYTGHLTNGSESPPIFPRVIDRLAELIPRVARETIEGAAHMPQLQTPERYLEVTTRAVQQAAA